MFHSQTMLYNYYIQMMFFMYFNIRQVGKVLKKTHIYT